MKPRKRKPGRPTDTDEPRCAHIVKDADCLAGLCGFPLPRLPGRPRGTTRGGSRHVQYKVNDAQYAELEAEGPTANAAARARAFPAQR